MAKEEKVMTREGEIKKNSRKTTSKKTTTTKTASKTTKPKKDMSSSAIAKVKENVKVSSKSITNSTTIIQKENHYGRTLLAAILIVFIFIGGYVAIQYKNSIEQGEEKKYVVTEDEKKFKKEYESLNGTTRSNGQRNKDVSIIEANHIRYINISEAAEILDSGSGIIYFGFAACPWCRNAVPVLLDAMQATDLDTIYYVNVREDDNPNKDIRDTYVLDSKNKARQSREAEKAYYDVLRLLANDLDSYFLTTENGKIVDVGEKRLSLPTVVAVKDGIVLKVHKGTFEGHNRVDGVLEDLTKEQQSELFHIYSALIGKYINNDCSTEENEEGC